MCPKKKAMTAAIPF